MPSCGVCLCVCLSLSPCVYDTDRRTHIQRERERERERDRQTDTAWRQFHPKRLNRSENITNVLGGYFFLKHPVCNVRSLYAKATNVVEFNDLFQVIMVDLALEPQEVGLIDWLNDRLTDWLIDWSSTDWQVDFVISRVCIEADDGLFKSDK